MIKRLLAIFLAAAAALAFPVWAQAPSQTRVDLATPTTYSAAPGGTVAITLNWYRLPMAANYLQFMHLVGSGGALWSVDDHMTTSATWTAGPFSQTRTITLPATLTAGTYDVRVGLSGGNPWADIALAMGAGVTDPGNDRRYKVGTLTVSSGGNVAPQITSTPVTTARVGVAYAYRVTASDANGDTLRYSLTRAPSGMTINATSGQIAWTPTSAQTGNRSVTVRVADPAGLAATQSFTIAVSSGNVAPQITSTPVTAAAVGLAYAYTVTATDANGDTLSYSLTQAPAGMSIHSASGQIAWTPGSAQAGNHAVTARVADPGGLAATQSFTVSVTSSNVAPQITSTPITSATVGAAYAYRVTATDANGDTLTYSLTQAPAGMTINSTSGQIGWTPGSTQAGSHAVTARVVDPGGLAATQSFTVTVASANVAPQITSTPVTSAAVGTAYAYRVTATDANGDPLSYSLTQAPAGMSINSTSGQIAWTPTSAQTGSHAVTARVADPGGLAATQSFTVTVASANVAPQITSSPVTGATVGAAYSYRVTATDANGDPLSYSLTQAPAGMTINATGGQITWTPTSTQTGSHAVTARVADPGGLAATQSFTVTVATSASPSPQIGNSWRIMPVGDSNTENLATFPGYQTITQALSASGRNSQVFGYMNANEPVVVSPVTAPQVGRSGWNTSHVISQINGWVDQVTPDIVLLNIGVNDGYFPNDPAAQDAVVGRIATIVDMIHARNSRTAVFVSNFERSSDPMPTVYSKIQQMVQAKAANSSGIFYKVFFVPSLTGVLGTMYVSDGVHPNDSGRLIAMNHWKDAVLSYVQTGNVPLPTVSAVPLTTRAELATPSTYYALPGARVGINLNWYRMPMAANLMQFMHLSVNSVPAASVDDHFTTSATWAPGPFAQTRTITAPTALGTYEIRVGLSGGNPWKDFALISGVGVLDERNFHTYRVGTLVVTNTPPP
ncbi:MAG: tandem-95 repeat protein [Rubrivivax sp.]|nr:tandem-95 repeat protein [Rubrivivax sp.]